MRVRTKFLMLLITFGVLPMTLVGSYCYYQVLDTVTKIRINNLVAIADLKASHVATYFADLQRDLRSAQRYFNLRKNLPTLNSYVSSQGSDQYKTALRMLDGQLQTFLEEKQLFNVLLINPDGLITYSADKSRRNELIGTILSEIADELLVDAMSEVTLSPMYHNNDIDRHWSYLAGPIYDFEGKLAGAVVFVLDLAYLYDLFEDYTGLGLSGETYIGRREGELTRFVTPLRHHSNAALRLTVPRDSGFAAPIRYSSQGRSGSGEEIDYRGVTALAAWRTMDILKQRWGLVAKIDKDEALALGNHIAKALIFVFVLTLACVFIIASRVAGSFSRPIHLLASKGDLVAQGKFDTRVEVSKRKDEVGDLLRSFNKMVAGLEETTISRDKLQEEVEQRKIVERDLLRSNKELEQFAYVASHDLQEPLRMIGSFAELLDREYKGKFDERGEKWLYYLIDASARMRRLVQDLLAYSRTGKMELRLTSVDTASVVEGVVSDLSPLIEEHSATVVVEGLPTVLGDEGQLRLVFQNLIDNAIKFRKPNTQPIVTVRAKENTKTCSFWIEDNGIGIEQEFAEKVFVIFQRLHGKDKYPGTGLGLAICKKVIERHGGGISVERNDKGGSTFKFDLQTVKRGMT